MRIRSLVVAAGRVVVRGGLVVLVLLALVGSVEVAVAPSSLV